jgi:hypothetical protein
MHEWEGSGCMMVCGERLGRWGRRGAAVDGS